MIPCQALKTVILQVITDSECSYSYRFLTLSGILRHCSAVEPWLEGGVWRGRLAGSPLTPPTALFLSQAAALLADHLPGLPGPERRTDGDGTPGSS